MPRTISAVITAYNSERYVGDAIASIRAQTVAPSEIVVIDDGSTDLTSSEVRKLGADIRYFRQDNSGEPSARNKGVEISRGDLIAFLDADDAWPHDHLQLLSAPFDSSPNIEIVSGRGRAFQDEGWMEALQPSPQRPEAHMMSFGCSLIARTAFDKVGSIDTAIRHGCDLDWFLRCRESGVSIIVLDAVTLLYRRHSESMTSDPQKGREGLMHIARIALNRRRASDRTEKLPGWQNLGSSRPDGEQ
jgi:glycosyltransferase involved in cell wall biosynthesis